MRKYCIKLKPDEKIAEPTVSIEDEKPGEEKNETVITKTDEEKPEISEVDKSLEEEKALVEQIKQLPKSKPFENLSEEKKEIIGKLEEVRNRIKLLAQKGKPGVTKDISKTEPVIKVEPAKNPEEAKEEP